MSVVYLAWWALFQSKNPDYDHSSNSNYPDQELTNELNQYAQENGFNRKQPANNDELLDYAALLFTSVLADNVINYTRTQLFKDKTFTAEQGANMYDLVNNELKDDIIDKSKFGSDWSTRVWTHQAALRSDLLGVMRQSLLKQENPMSSVKDIRDKYQVFNYQSERILRTEGARVSLLQQKSDIKNAGYGYYEWVTSPGACNICLDRDGRRYKANHEPTLPHPNCRCSIIAVAKDE